MLDDKETLKKIMYEMSLTNHYIESIGELLATGQIWIRLAGENPFNPSLYSHPLKLVAFLESEMPNANNSLSLDLLEEWIDYIDGQDEEDKKEIAKSFVKILEESIEDLTKRFKL